MDTVNLQSAIAEYSKTNDLRGLASAMRELVLYMAKGAKIGYEVKFTNDLPAITDALKSLDLENMESICSR